MDDYTGHEEHPALLGRCLTRAYHGQVGERPEPTHDSACLVPSAAEQHTNRPARKLVGGSLAALTPKHCHVSSSE